MPPSGYTLEQSKSVNEFLGSCANALEKEGTEKRLLPMEALRVECENIKKILHTDNEECFATGVLNLTYSFYSEIIKLEPKSYSEFHLLVDKTLNKVKDEILRVHVPEI